MKGLTMFKYLFLVTIFVLAGCEHGANIPIDPPDSPELCQTILDGKVVVVECDTLTPCSSDRDCELGYYCLNDNYCVNDCLTDETCEGRYGDGYTCNVRGRCVGPTHPPVEPPVQVCPAYIGGVVLQDVPCDDLIECDPAADNCPEGTFCLDGDYDYCASQCFTDEGCPEFCKFGTGPGTDKPCVSAGNMVCNDSGLCENPDPLPVCGEETEIRKANVVFIVDRSGSMSSDFGNISRYDAVSTALINLSLSVSDDYADFSAALYSRSTRSYDRDACAAVTEFSSNIEELFNSTAPGGYTPTGEAIAEILANNTFPENTAFVLATDGLPNGCDGRADPTAPGDSYSVQQVAAAFDAGIPVYILGIALNSEQEGHLNDLAVAGGTGLDYFNVNNTDQLDDALLDIVGHIVTPVTCEPLPNPPLPDWERPEPPIVVQ